ncbi:5-oxoproline transporter, DUF969 family subunit, partial [Klebsiella pneumoniae]|uniref:5-oxoproline transporter, DUF969 family subunit n=1 Tax=Klebsiella pneumoniae TaxID=573 RepID=UPI00201072B3
ATAVAAGHGLLESLGLLGTGVLKGRFLLVIRLTFPVIGLLERYGLREAALGLGATRWQCTRQVVLPMALPGILTGAILAIARAIGETAPLVVVGAV